MGEFDAFASDMAAPSLPLGEDEGCTPAVPTAEMALLAAGLLVARERYELAKEAVKGIEEKMAEQLYIGSDAVGEEASVVAGKFNIKVARGERWSWDQDQLGELVHFDYEPDGIVETRFSVPRKVFEALPPATQDDFRKALTRKPGPLTIKIDTIS